MTVSENLDLGAYLRSDAAEVAEDRDVTKAYLGG